MGSIRYHFDVAGVVYSFLILLSICFDMGDAAPGSSSIDSIIPLIHPDQYRPIGSISAGNISMMMSGSVFGYPGGVGIPRVDPETGNDLQPGCVSPPQTGRWFMERFSLWVGGVVDGDTLLSEGSVWSSYDARFTYFKEFWPEHPAAGGIRRTGMYSDDEFMTVYSDTITDERFLGRFRPFSDTVHMPLGIEIAERVYCWSDTGYDNFAIVTYQMTNLLGKNISNGWIGFYMNISVFDSCRWPEWWWYSPNDDFCGILDTVFYPDDPENEVMIAYGFDNDGDPVADSWGKTSVRGAVSYRVLESSLVDPVFNFNWWTRDYSGLEFGPRRLGSQEDPLRIFAGGGIGVPEKDEDKYYVMAHPEVDYNMLETAIHDSSDGWVPCLMPQDGYIPKCLLSFGPFDLGTDDTVQFTLAIVISDNLHGNATGFADHFSVDSPLAFQAQLDFTDVMTQHRRADSVYRSGFTLPVPGPPQGLKVIDYEDSFVKLAWHPSALTTLDGYYVYLLDTAYGETWRRALPDLILDTTCSVPIYNPGRIHYFAISAYDTLDRESGKSMAVSLIPARPHPPCSLTVTLDGAVPVLTWRPGSDTSLVAYIIYRSAWKEDFALYDSTSTLHFRDEDAESGVRYHYMVCAVNEHGLESPPAGPVSALPMAFDRELIFYDMNNDFSPRLDPYHKMYVDRLIHSIQLSVSMDYHDIEDSLLPFTTMSRYRVMIVDMEKRGGYFPIETLQWFRLYLAHGGRALFIAPNASMQTVPTISWRKNYYAPGNFFYDAFHLDSSVSNAIVYADGMLYGDLSGCQPALVDYPVLPADSVKIGSAPVPVHGYLPLAGFLYPHDDVDLLYRYESMYPDSLFHNQVNGIRHISDSGGFVLFNFPLSLMASPANVLAFRLALTDLGLNLTCGDVTDDQTFNLGDIVYCINYLYREGPPPPDPPRADVNCDTLVDVADVIFMINAIFRGGGNLECCL